MNCCQMGPTYQIGLKTAREEKKNSNKHNENKWYLLALLSISETYLINLSLQRNKYLIHDEISLELNDTIYFF